MRMRIRSKTKKKMRVKKKTAQDLSKLMLKSQIINNNLSILTAKRIR